MNFRSGRRLSQVHTRKICSWLPVNGNERGETERYSVQQELFDCLQKNGRPLMVPVPLFPVNFNIALFSYSPRGAVRLNEGINLPQSKRPRRILSSFPNPDILQGLLKVLRSSSVRSVFVRPLDPHSVWQLHRIADQLSVL